ncbi:MAG: hypothetical protein ABL883_07025 [Terricaulis sp.]
MGEQAKAGGSLKASLGAAWSWFSQIASVVGLVGIVEDLKIWLVVWNWGRARLHDVLPGLEQFLVAAGAAIHQGLEDFRGLYRPAFEFLFGWLPFDVPIVAMDVAVVALFVLGSRWRVGAAYLKQWGKLSTAENQALTAAAAGMGIQFAPREVYQFKRAVDGYQHKKHLDFDLAAEEIAWARAQWGEKFDAFAETQKPAWENLSPTAKGLLAGQRRVMFFIYALAALVALLLAAELVWFR